MPDQPPSPLIPALTPAGLALAGRIAAGLGAGEPRDVRGAVGPTLGHAFETGRPLICIMALGIVVRTLGPLAGDKVREPGVVVVDEAGTFAVSVLGGHRGGANALARRVAAVIGATPVITTASDALGLPAVDLIGAEFGWRVEPGSDLTRLAAAVVRAEPVAVYQDVGRRDWRPAVGPWPDNVVPAAGWPPPGKWSGVLAISDRMLTPVPAAPVVTYRPRTLVLGVGCKRGVPAAEIAAFFTAVFAAHGFSPLSLAAVATASIKADEPGLIGFAADRGVPLLSFTPAELVTVRDLPSPSEKVRQRVGVPGVAEPAAVLAARAEHLLIPKQKAARVTLALARRDEAAG